ncbi:MAG: hypothetical protein ABFD08_18735 [Syntrophomonas sp.]
MLSSIEDKKDSLNYFILERCKYEEEISMLRLTSRSEYHLQNTNEKTRQDTQDKYTYKMYMIKEKLLMRVQEASNQEIAELYDLITNDNKLPSLYYINYDKDFKSIIGLFSLFTKQEREKCKYFNPYKQLIKTFHQHYRHGIGWSATRKEIIKKRGQKCELCGSNLKLEVHHLEDTINNEATLLQVVCHSCHEQIHKSMLRKANYRTKVFHKFSCIHSNSKDITTFLNRDQALGSGYRPCGICKP